MDESERRRERLKAIRSKAAQGQASSANQVQLSGFRSGLANPLIDDASSLQEMPRSAPRFDYYTDPMASFSANRRGNVPLGFMPNPGHGRQMSPHPEPWNPAITMHPFPGPRAYQAGYPFNGCLPYRAPIDSDNPYRPHHEMPPGVGNQSGCAVSHHPQSNFPRGASFPNYGGRSSTRDFSLGRGRGRPHQGPYAGRGRGNWADNKARMGSEQSSSSLGSANQVSKSLYEKFMVDDPWKSLKPSIWHEEKPVTSLISSKTVGVKRPLEISGLSTSSSQSLAEYLADSFNEASKSHSDA